MKTSLAALCTTLVWSHTRGFTVIPATQSSQRRTPFVIKSSTAVAEATKDESTAKAGSVYEKLGITKDQLGFGVDPNEVLEWIGTREDMIEKAMQDISKFDRAKAEAEVDKYLLDSEMMNYHIEFKKRLEDNPDMLMAEEPKEGFFSFQTVVYTYFGYIFGELIYRNFLNQYVNLDFIPGWGPREMSAVEGGDAAAADAAASAVDAASSVVESVSNSI